MPINWWRSHFNLSIGCNCCFLCAQACWSLLDWNNDEGSCGHSNLTEAVMEQILCGQSIRKLCSYDTASIMQERRKRMVLCLAAAIPLQNNDEIEGSERENTQQMVGDHHLKPRHTKKSNTKTIPMSTMYPIPVCSLTCMARRSSG